MAVVSPDTTIGDLIDLSTELEDEGAIQGQIRLYNTDNESRIESDPERFLERTLLTEGLRKSLTTLRDSLRGEDPRGTHLLQGPFGTGKSHQMVVLYHCFNAPGYARQRFDEDVPGFGDALPDDAVPITVSLQYSQPDELWEPFFDSLDYDPGSYEEGGFPVIETIEEAIGDRQVAFFVDELERWYNTLSDDRKETTKGFLQALLEAAGQLDNLNVFLSILRSESDVHGVIDREQVGQYLVPINMREDVDVRELVHHRLFGDFDITAEIEAVVDEYVEAYEASENVVLADDLRSRMYRTYPFHPQLLDTLEACYYSEAGNQAVRGMLYLLSKVVVSVRNETDLVTHGDLEPRVGEDQDVGTELLNLNAGIHDACTDDMERVVNADIPYGVEILSTILLYSLRPGPVEQVGADTSDIVLGVYHRGDTVSDIVRDLNRVDNGKAWHLHEAGGRYAIRESRTISALIEDERAAVDDDAAYDHIRDAITDIFDGGHPVVTEDDLIGVPDEKTPTVVINTREWTADAVRTVITDGGSGRKYRNTLVFVQPTDEVTDSATVNKAIEIRAAERVADQRSLEDDLRSEARDRADREQSELRDRIEIKYGAILDGADLLNDFDDAIAREFEAYGVDANAAAIAEAMRAGQFQLREAIAEVAMDLIDRKDKATVEAVFEEFLRRPGNPMPTEVDTVVRVADELESEPLLVFRPNHGFRDEFRIESPTDTLVHQDAVDHWDTDAIRSELDQRLSADDVVFDDFAAELRDRTDILLTGDVAAAAEALRQDGDCVFVRGRRTVDRPQGATLRKDYRLVDTEEVRTRLAEAATEDGRADVGTVLSDLPETAVFDDVQSTVREAITQLLDDDYLLERGYEDKLPDGRNPLSVALVPTVDAEAERQIMNRIREFDEGETFSVVEVAPGMPEEQARSCLLHNLRGDDPEYLLEGGSSNPSEWTPGEHFRIPGGTWSFSSQHVDEIETLRADWRDEAETGELTTGFVSFTLASGPPLDEIQQVVDTTSATNEVELTLAAGQSHTRVRDLIDRIPPEATDITVELEFEK